MPPTRCRDERTAGGRALNRRMAGAAALLTLGLVVFVPQPAAVAEPSTSVPYASGGAATRYAGPAFDTCTAPPLSTMQAWLASPYRAIGIYIGGTNRGCAQPQLTSSWVG